MEYSVKLVKLLRVVSMKFRDLKIQKMVGCCCCYLICTEKDFLDIIFKIGQTVPRWIYVTVWKDIVSS